MLPPYTLIRSNRRTLSLQIASDGNLVVRAPRLYPKWMIELFIKKKTYWITKHQQIQNKKKIYSPSERSDMQKVLQQYLDIRVNTLWKMHHLPPYTNIKITSAEHRWGSCSAKNKLCFSYRLAEYIETYPLFIDAVIIHELAHLQEKHHQQAFWDLVFQMMPGYTTVIKKHRSLP